MIHIDDPPDQQACAPCASALLWLWSPRRKAWVAFLPTDDLHVIRYHPCRHAQDFATWKEIHKRPSVVQVRINAAGRAVVEEALRDQDRIEE